MFCQSNSVVFFVIIDFLLSCCCFKVQVVSSNECFTYESQTLRGNDTASGDDFGLRTGSYGDYIVVGARFNDNGGSVHVFRKDKNNNGKYVFFQKLRGHDTVSNDRFGNSVSIYNDTIVIGAPYQDSNGDNAGCIYIFSLINDKWVETDQLFASDGSSADYFGGDARIWGNVIAVKSQYDDDGATNSGSVYIFNRNSNSNSWFESQKLTASDGSNNDEFGLQLTLYENKYLVIGSKSEQAYIFEKNDSTSSEWVEVAILTGDEIANGDGFGMGIGIYDIWAFVGSFTGNKVYIFKRNETINEWQEHSILMASDINDTNSIDNFGRTIAVYDNYAVIGSYTKDMAYLFKKEWQISSESYEWIEITKLLSSDDDNVGFYVHQEVFIDENIAIIPHADNDIVNIYPLYIYDDDNNNNSTINNNNNNLTSNWWDNELMCLRKYGTHLVTFLTQDDVNNFKLLCNNSNSSNSCWIGYNNYYSSDGEWFWLSDGSTKNSSENSLLFYQLTGLNVNDSKSNDDGKESCIFYNSSTDLFAFGDCTDPLLNMNFVCQDSDWYDSLESTQAYVSLPYHMNWFEAEKFCSSMYGTNLASIMSLRENEMTLTMSDSFNNLTYWIGLYNFDVLNDESFEYRWTNFGKENSDSNSKWRKWDDSAYNKNSDSISNDDISYNCVYFDSSNNGVWLCDDCQNDDTHLIMCDNPFKSQNNFNFNDRYVIAPSITTSSLMTFSEARISCMLYYGTHLATIRNKYENDVIFNMTSNYSIAIGSNRTLIGYFSNNGKNGNNNKFVWDNYHVNDDIDYENWDWCDAQPYDYDYDSSDEDCVFIVHDGGKWHDLSCDSGRKSIGVCDSPYYNGGEFIEDSLSYISIHTCSNWNNISFLQLTDTINIVIQDSSGDSSNYIIVNSFESLPLAGKWKTYVLNDTSLLNLENSITSISIGLDSSDFDYCIDGLIAVINGESFVLNDAIKNGIILSDNCENLQFFYNDILDELIYCNEGLFTIYTQYGGSIVNNMYKISLHSCSVDGSDIDFSKLSESNNLKLSLIGKDSDSNTWISSNSISLSHVALNGYVDWNQVGTILASNVLLFSNNSHYVISSEISGTLVGLKIVVSPMNKYYGDESFWKFSQWKFTAASCQSMGSGTQGCDDSTIMFEYDVTSYGDTNIGKLNWGVSASTWIISRSFIDDNDMDDTNFLISLDDNIEFYLSDTSKASFDIGNNDYVIVDIFGIFEEEIDNYYLPYHFSGTSNGKVTQSEAENYCILNYGTHLSSIHSYDELIANMLVAKGSKHWIGLTDRYNEFKYEWTDYSSVNYESWCQTCTSFGEYQWHDCVNVYLKWFKDNSCDDNLYYTCSSGAWNQNIKRTFNIPIASSFRSDNIVMVSLSNSDRNDAICIENVLVNGESATYMANKWIGDNSGNTIDECSNSNNDNDNDNDNSKCASTSYAIMKWPICNMEITNINYDWDDIDIYEDSSSMSGLECSNYNRLHSTTCSINKEFTFDTTKSFEFSEEQTFSTSSSSSVTQGSSVSKESTNTFGESFSESSGTEFTVGAEVTTSAKFFGNGVDVTVSSSLSLSEERTSESNWQRSSSKISEQFSQVSRERSIEKSQSTSNSMTMSTSFSESVSCSASMDIPPSTSVDYSLTFSQFEAIITTYSDLKLTLCSAYIDNNDGNDGDDDDSNVMYIRNIKGEVGVDVTGKCDVIFNEPKKLSNEMTCYEEQQIAWLSQSSYVPVCNNSNSQYYDGCQCKFGDESGTSSCICVDIYGNPLENGEMLLNEYNEYWQDTCKILNCQNSIYNSDMDTTTTQSSGGGALLIGDNSNDNNDNEDNDDELIIIVILVGLLLLFTIIICIFVCLYYKQKKKNSKNNNEKIANIIQSSINSNMYEKTNHDQGNENENEIELVENV